VSIAVACQCPEGIVLCTDTLFTSPGNSKDYGCKLWFESDETETWIVHFAYCGMKDFMDAFKERFREKLTPVPDTLAIRDAIESALASLYADARHEYASGAELFCAIRVGSQLSLYKTYGSLVSFVSERCRVLGENPLTKYLVPLLTQSGPGWDLPHAAVIAAYITRCARAHVDGCGGEWSDMWIIRSSGGWFSVGTAGMMSFDKKVGMLEWFAGEVLSCLCSSIVDNAEFESLASQLHFHLTEAHRDLERLLPRMRRL
jgi:hypothetical protein